MEASETDGKRYSGSRLIELLTGGDILTRQGAHVGETTWKFRGRENGNATRDGDTIENFDIDTT